MKNTKRGECVRCKKIGEVKKVILLFREFSEFPYLCWKCRKLLADRLHRFLIRLNY